MSENDKTPPKPKVKPKPPKPNPKLKDFITKSRD
jgi:hypothetical protein